MNGKKYPEVEKFIHAIKELNIELKPGINTPELEELFYNIVNLTYREKTVIFPVNDEYKDVEQGNPVVLLNLVLQECEYFEEAVEYDIWAKDIGLDKSFQEVHDLYVELRTVVPIVRNLLGKNLTAIPYFEIEFNTGIAQSLRNAKVN